MVHADPQYTILQTLQVTCPTHITAPPNLIFFYLFNFFSLDCFVFKNFLVGKRKQQSIFFPVSTLANLAH